MQTEDIIDSCASDRDSSRRDERRAPVEGDHGVADILRARTRARTDARADVEGDLAVREVFRRYKACSRASPGRARRR